MNCLRAPLLCLLVLALAGCQPPTSSRLLGTWRGVPDSPAAEVARTQERLKAETAKNPDAPPDARTLVAAEAAKSVPLSTDLEVLDFVVGMQFESRGNMTLQLNNDPPQNATWQIVDTSPTGAVVEVTLVDKQANEKENEKSKSGKDDLHQKRRFEIEFESDQPQDGFHLREVGADRRFGQLYFQPAAALPAAAKEPSP